MAKYRKRSRTKRRMFRRKRPFYKKKMVRRTRFRRRYSGIRKGYGKALHVFKEFPIAPFDINFNDQTNAINQYNMPTTYLSSCIGLDNYREVFHKLKLKYVKLIFTMMGTDSAVSEPFILNFLHPITYGYDVNNPTVANFINYPRVEYTFDDSKRKFVYKYKPRWIETTDDNDGKTSIPKCDRIWLNCASAEQNETDDWSQLQIFANKPKPETLRGFRCEVYCGVSFKGLRQDLTGS